MWNCTLVWSAMRLWFDAVLMRTVDHTRPRTVYTPAYLCSLSRDLWRQLVRAQEKIVFLNIVKLWRNIGWIWWNFEIVSGNFWNTWGKIKKKHCGRFSHKYWKYCLEILNFETIFEIFWSDFVDVFRMKYFEIFKKILEKLRRKFWIDPGKIIKKLWGNNRVSFKLLILPKVMKKV